MSRAPAGEPCETVRWPLVLLHGQPGAASDWNPVVAALTPGRRVLALDRPGYRSNPDPPGGIAANVDWTLGQMDAAGVPEAVLVGHSYGGGVALAAAAQAPERIRGLILVASVGPQCLDGWDALLASPFLGPLCAVAAWWLTPWFARMRMAYIQRRLRRPLAPGEHVYWEIWGHAQHQHGHMWRTFLTEQRDLVRNLDRLCDRLPAVAAPTLILADPGDAMIPVTTAQALQRSIPDAELVLLDGGGHHLPRRAPEKLAEHIDRFAAIVDRAGVPRAGTFARTADAAPHTISPV